MKTRIKINALALVVALILCAFFPYFLIRRAEGCFDDILEMSGIVLVLAGLLLRISARGYKAENSSNGNSLVTGGPYSLVRNPMYLGIIASGSGIVLVIGQWWGLLLFLAGFFLQYLYLFRREERLLEQAFGQAYREYVKRVPRIIPSWRSLKMDMREILPLKIKWMQRELLSISLVFAGVIVVEGWEEVSFHGWPGLIYGFVKLLAVFTVFIVLFLYLLIHEKASANNRNSL